MKERMQYVVIDSQLRYVFSEVFTDARDAAAIAEEMCHRVGMAEAFQVLPCYQA